MPIKSYLVYPKPRQHAALAQALRGLPGCDVVPAENRDVLVLVTDTADDAGDAELLAQVQALPSLQWLTLVAGFNDSEANGV